MDYPENENDFNESIVRNTITKYWLEYYMNEGCCSLCGNSGLINTEGLKNPRGEVVGRKNYCICPNGQTRRKMDL